MVILVFWAKAQLRKESCVLGKKLDYENAQSSDKPIVQLEINAASQENEFLKGLLGNPMCTYVYCAGWWWWELNRLVVDITAECFQVLPF